MAHDFHCPVGVKPWEDDYCCQRCNPGETPPWERTCICDSSLGSSPVTHDPMCPTQTMCKCKDQECWDCREVVLCQCDLVAKVRENERTRWHGADYSVDWHRGYQQGLADGKGHTCPDNNCCHQSTL